MKAVGRLFCSFGPLQSGGPLLLPLLPILGERLKLLFKKRDPQEEKMLAFPLVKPKGTLSEVPPQTLR